jgi:hypothetical protein
MTQISDTVHVTHDADTFTILERGQAIRVDRGNGKTFSAQLRDFAMGQRWPWAFAGVVATFDDDQMVLKFGRWRAVLTPSEAGKVAAAIGEWATRTA